MKCGKNIRGALSYNERKLSAGKAELLLANGFGCDVSELGFTQRLKRFQYNIENASAERNINTVHISLNFAAEDMVSDDAMRMIALDYMRQIGFGEQPFLVYKHNDANHQHFHIVTTNIKERGGFINLHNLVQRKSEPARKAIELDYALIQASSRKNRLQLPVKPADLTVARYSDAPTKTTISNIVLQVVDTYKFTSLQELNAVLRQFNAIAQTNTIHGKKTTTGVVYSLVDELGFREGQGIKASALYTSPTYAVLQEKFRKNLAAKNASKEDFAARLTQMLAFSSGTAEFMQALKNNRFGCAVEYDTAGTVKEILFVNHASRTVYSATELGMQPKGIVATLAGRSQSSSKEITRKVLPAMWEAPDLASALLPQVLQALFTPEYSSQEVDSEFFKKKRKKKKRPS